MPIRILAPEVANQIAAGEVVERPASAVKELVENSLDAGATDIRVEVRDGGRRLIRVQDDGVGIPAAEVALAFERHATSKIAYAADLDRITTLGFRGEALASIGSVAQVSLLTRARDEQTGVLVKIAEGHETGRQPSGGPGGTTVTVEHLFANVPARLKFLKQPATEAAHIQGIVTRYALAYPDRRFSLVSDGRLLLQTSGSGKLTDVLAKVYGPEVARLMLPLGSATAQDGEEHSDRPGKIRVTGYAGAPGLHRGNRSYISLFVNRRWFQDTSVAYAVIQAYHTLLPVGRFPLAVVFVEMDPADLDVNVHPTKAEVRFREPGAVFGAVQRAVRRAIVDLAPVPELTPGTPLPLPGTSPYAPTSSHAGAGDWDARRAALLGAGRGQLPMALTGPAGDGPLTQGGDGHLDPSPHTVATPERGTLLPLLRVVGQLGATYIVAEGPDGMYLIDQHAAHERVLFEQMLSEHASKRLAVQPLLEPLALELSPEQAGVVAEELETLNELGVAIEPFGGSAYLVRSLPAVLGRDDPLAALGDIIDALALRDDLVETTHEARLITAICKRAAVKGGSPLGLAEMQELVLRLEGCRSPRTCPHGRPTMIYLSATELARQFGRL